MSHDLEKLFMKRLKTNTITGKLLSEPYIRMTILLIILIPIDKSKMLSRMTNPLHLGVMALIITSLKL